jgi:hypothetical protein
MTGGRCPAIQPVAGAALQPVRLGMESAVCLENGAWIVEAVGFVKRHQFRLTS